MFWWNWNGTHCHHGHHGKAINFHSKRQTCQSGGSIWLKYKDLTTFYSVLVITCTIVHYLISHDNTPYRYLSAITGYHTGSRKTLTSQYKYLMPQWKSDCCMRQKFKRPGQWFKTLSWLNYWCHTTITFLSCRQIFWICC